MKNLIVKLKAYVICEINKNIDYHNEWTYTFSNGYRKAMNNVLIKIEELSENT